ncbi:unnamed protein product [Prunus armeniaca]
MVTAIDYSSMHSTYSQKLSPEVQSDLLADVDSSLSITLSPQQAEEIHRLSILDAVYSSDAQLSQHHDELTHLKEEKTVIEKIHVLSHVDVEALDTLQASFERLRNGFRDLTWE